MPGLFDYLAQSLGAPYQGFAQPSSFGGVGPSPFSALGSSLAQPGIPTTALSQAGMGGGNSMYSWMLPSLGDMSGRTPTLPVSVRTPYHQDLAKLALDTITGQTNHGHASVSPQSTPDPTPAPLAAPTPPPAPASTPTPSANSRMGPMVQARSASDPFAAPYQFEQTGGQPSGAMAGLSAVEAASVCGPLAAVAFAHAYGRFPSVAEAKTIAQQNGLWDQDNGMHGGQSEQSLLSLLGVGANFRAGTPDWASVGANVSGTHPLIIDTPGHYLYADGYDPSRGFHVGNTGRALRGGSDWLTPEMIASLGHGIQGILTGSQ